jgi:hypothetical protein
VTTADVFGQLENWYREQCDGEWEHASGIRIETLDNPGWSLVVDLTGTKADGVSLEHQVDDTGNPDWIYWWSDGVQFEANTGPAGLARAVGAFLLFIDTVERRGLA